jgi:hypothetical protein
MCSATFTDFKYLVVQRNGSRRWVLSNSPMTCGTHYLSRNLLPLRLHSVPLANTEMVLILISFGLKRAFIQLYDHLIMIQV